MGKLEKVKRLLAKTARAAEHVRMGSTVLTVEGAPLGSFSMNGQPIIYGLCFFLQDAKSFFFAIMLFKGYVIDSKSRR